MKRLLLVCVAAALGTVVADAANPKVDQAIKAFMDVADDPQKLKTYCQMSDVEESLGDRDDDASDAALDPYLDRLGPDFEEAWETYEETDEDTPDGKRLNAALDALDDRCPDDDDGTDDDD